MPRRLFCFWGERGKGVNATVAAALWALMSATRELRSLLSSLRFAHVGLTILGERDGRLIDV